MLRSILRITKAVVSETLGSVYQKLAFLKERTDEENIGFFKMTESAREALALYSRECDRRLREREQELTMGHELEMADVKKLIESRDEEICTLKRNLLEKETELAEHERLISTMRQKLETEQTEMRDLQTRLHLQLEETLEQARVERETAVEKVNEERFLEVAALTNSVTQCQKRIQELEESLNVARSDQQRLVKEATDKLQIEYKLELESIRSRFKSLMAASTMERSTSDTSLEKIEVSPFNDNRVLIQIKFPCKLKRITDEAFLFALSETRFHRPIQPRIPPGEAGREARKNTNSHRGGSSGLRIKIGRKATTGGAGNRGKGQRDGDVQDD